ncbi:hypothetical protein N9R34_01550 [Candidatus Thioglobus sp.]|nr:hypothetical protein [Candidatus Thioglobus sp.]
MKKLLLLLSLLLSFNSYGEYTKVGDIFTCEVTGGTLISPGFSPVKEFSGGNFLLRVEENTIALYGDLNLSREPTILNIIELSRPANPNDRYGFFIAGSQQGDQGEILKFNYGNLAYSNVGASNGKTVYMSSYIAECEFLL